MAKKPIALIIDDEPDILQLLSMTLSRMNVDSQSACNVKEALSLLDSQPFDVCLTDMRLPDGDGLQIVSHIQANHPQLPVAVITAHGNMQTAIEAMKLGAFDFLSKPVDLAVLRNLVQSALRLNSPQAKSSTQRQSNKKQLIGDSEVMRQLKQTILKLARSQAPVYIRGESGTGKELVAKLIHFKGPRAEQPFVPVNCGAIPAELIESEFFGHVKGSFTGAVSDKKGLFQAANGGTLFLDEIAELPLAMQVKLLRAIQEKSIRPVGSEKEIPVDVRILSASHKDLSSLVESGEFRQDLFYRINVIELEVPPLRERREDIPAIADYLLAQIIRRQHSHPVSLSSDALNALCHYDFPGNIRELENILERALTLCNGQQIEKNDLQLPDSQNGAPTTDLLQRGEQPLDDFLEQIERREILEALRQAGGNKTHAAKILGISFRALRYKLQKLNIAI